mmetsp:Transcript_3215/g.13187  ORF Transcript_3215/g.13187 Transcript_3215/m.13187 type:complete len:250 (+) Transcript_3215:426-1175(+)
MRPPCLAATASARMLLTRARGTTPAVPSAWGRACPACIIDRAAAHCRSRGHPLRSSARMAASWPVRSRASTRRWRWSCSRARRFMSATEPATVVVLEPPTEAEPPPPPTLLLPPPPPAPTPAVGEMAPAAALVPAVRCRACLLLALPLAPPRPAPDPLAPIEAKPRPFPASPEGDSPPCDPALPPLDAVRADEALAGALGSGFCGSATKSRRPDPIRRTAGAVKCAPSDAAAADPASDEAEVPVFPAAV